MPVEVFMKHELMQRPLRLATAQAYSSPLRGPGSLWVARSAEQFALDEPIDASRGRQPVASALAGSAGAAERSFRREDIEGICANPLRDDRPGPVIVGAVKRFGLVGLVTCALGTGLARWWYSVTHRDH